jgi:exonuclease SbcC
VRVLELSLRNYRVFEEVDLDLPPKVIGVFGENGSGKSTLMESIGFACFGVDAARTKKHEIRTGGLLTDCVVRMAFEHAGRQYEVRRVLRGKGSAPEAELYAGDLLLASGTTEVDAEMRALLHMDLHVFRASVFAEQKQLDALSSMRPGERKEMALRLLGIKPVDDARSAARREAKVTRQSAEQLSDATLDVTELEAKLKEAKDVALEAGRRAKAVSAELKRAKAAHRQARKAFDASNAGRERAEKLLVALRAATEERERHTVLRDELSKRVDELAGRLAELPEIEERLTSLAGAEERLRAAERVAELTRQESTLRTELERVAAVDLDRATGRLSEARANARAAEGAAAKARAAREHATTTLEAAERQLARASQADPSEPCPTCGRPLGEDFAGYLKHCREQVSEAKRVSQEAARSLARAEAASRAAEGAQDQAEAAAERARSDHARRSDLAARAQAVSTELARLVDASGGSAPDVNAIRADVRTAKQLADRASGLRGEGLHQERMRRDLAEADERLDELERRLQALASEAERVAFDPGVHERLGAALAEAEARLEAAQERERLAIHEVTNAEREAARMEGELTQAREIAARVDELRSEGRHVERVAMLLDGFRDHLVGRVGPELSREAEALFRELTNDEYDDLKVEEETLNIHIADGASFHAIERFSGSETDLANLALRVAISTHLSRVSGADVGLMVLDEVLGSLDEERKDLMVQTLGRLAGRFHQLFVVTHAERVKDQFPAVIQVRKTRRRRSEAVLV